MKKILKFVLLLLAVALIPTETMAKKKKDVTVYMFGVGQNFNDSTVYMAPVQLLQGASLERKTNFLENRTAYASQLQNFLISNQGQGHYTCTVFYAEDKKAIEKKYAKVRRLQAGNTDVKLREIPMGTFAFSIPTPQEDTTNQE